MTSTFSTAISLATHWAKLSLPIAPANVTDCSSRAVTTATLAAKQPPFDWRTELVMSNLAPLFVGQADHKVKVGGAHYDDPLLLHLRAALFASPTMSCACRMPRLLNEVPTGTLHEGMDADLVSGG
jgi:hypothetical protein